MHSGPALTASQASRRIEGRPPALMGRKPWGSGTAPNAVHYFVPATGLPSRMNEDGGPATTGNRTDGPPFILEVEG